MRVEATGVDADGRAKRAVWVLIAPPGVGPYTPGLPALATIKRIAAGEAQTAGLPADRMPVVTVDPNPGLATWNTPDFSERMATFFKGRFGAGRVVETPPSMAGEDFGAFARTDPERIKTLIFWVGGRPQAEFDAAKREGRVLHGLHSPFWAPEADQVVATGAEALASAAIELMPKR